MSGLAGADSRQMADFQARIARINKAAPQQLREAQQVRQEKARLKRLKRPPGFLSNLFALVSGAAAVMAARLIHVRMGGGTVADLRETMVFDGAVALVVSAVVLLLFRLRIAQFLSLQVPAAAVMLIGMHNLVHVAPGLFSRVYPQAWVTSVLTTTEPKSLILADHAIVF